MMLDFHEHREIFVQLGVRDADSAFHLPRQHSMIHYSTLILEFGAPNGLCSSIMELKHIKAVKEPYRRSSKHNALGQILLTNQRLDKFKALRINLAFCRLLPPLSYKILAPQPPPPTNLQATGMDDVGPSDEPLFLGVVRLTCTRSKSLCYRNIQNILT